MNRQADGPGIKDRRKRITGALFGLLAAGAVGLVGLLVWPRTPPDAELMWETTSVRGNTGSKDPDQKASTERAVEAAYRVFSSLRLAGMSRQQVIAAVGDPKTSSDSIYNFPFYPPRPGAMVYRFDTGAGGWQFELVMNGQDVVTEVIARGIE